MRGCSSPVDSWSGAAVGDRSKVSIDGSDGAAGVGSTEDEPCGVGASCVGVSCVGVSCVGLSWMPSSRESARSVGAGGGEGPAVSVAPAAAPPSDGADRTTASDAAAVGDAVGAVRSGATPEAEVTPATEVVAPIDGSRSVEVVAVNATVAVSSNVLAVSRVAVRPRTTGRRVLLEGQSQDRGLHRVTEGAATGVEGSQHLLCGP